MKIPVVLSLPIFLLCLPLLAQEKHDEGSVPVDFGPLTLIKGVHPSTDSLLEQLSHLRSLRNVEMAAKVQQHLDSLYVSCNCQRQ